VALEFFWLLGTKRTAGGGLVSGTQRQQRGVRAMGLLGPRQPMRCFGLGLGLGFPEIPQPKNGRHRESRTPGPNDRNRDGGSMGAMIASPRCRLLGSWPSRSLCLDSWSFDPRRAARRARERTVGTGATNVNASRPDSAPGMRDRMRD
jgi:hypothetical protein